MKTATFLGRVFRVLPLKLAASLAVSPSLCAVQVDTELVILVDVSGTVSNTEFANVIESIASSFESSAVVDSITNGTIGSVATSLVFWSNRNRQEVGVSWLEISDANSAAQFADLVRDASRPFRGSSAIGSALLFGADTFGSETGGAGNGFESEHQAISILGDGEDSNTPGSGPREARLQAARDAAVAAGVDDISAIVLNDNNSDLEAYYQNNVIGGNGSTIPTVSEVDIDNIDQQVMELAFADTILGGATVPEPSSALLIGVAALLFVGRRRR